MIPHKKVLNVPVTSLPFEEQMMLILRWAKSRLSKVVCLANVHMLIEANQKPLFGQILHQADLVAPDGKPLVFMLRRLGIKHQNQVAGMEVFLTLCSLVEQSNLSVYFLGSTESILSKIKQKLDRDYPLLKVAGMKSIPFISAEDILAKKDHELVAEINHSGAGIVFVCLGCPKQEIWMSAYQGSIKGVMIGVGAVFAMYAGIKPRAPHWIQKAYLEWLFRFFQEPHRLWQRYSSTIPPFLYLAAKQLLFSSLDNQNKLNLKALTGTSMPANVNTLDFTSERLGQILVHQNAITASELNRALLYQQLNSDLKIGEILIGHKLISLPQLKFYLRNQNIKLGELLVERKYLKQKALNKFLLLQQKNTQKSPRLGEILLEQKILSSYQLNEILFEQYSRHKGFYLTEQRREANSLHIQI